MKKCIGQQIRDRCQMRIGTHGQLLEQLRYKYFFAIE